jgi:uracil-DNA glycosylase family 4
MQNFLFADEESKPTETLDEVNQELLEKAKAIPALQSRMFIFGEGEPGLRVAVVGESPGAPDAASGRPFMGPAGEMLVKILNSIGLKREDCYLTNTVKYISAGDELTPEILNFFIPYLHRELAVVRPEIIISFGATPTKALLNTKKPISQIRGDFQDYGGFARIMPTFNPAYLLRDPTKKREVWEDMKKIRAELSASK